MRAERTGLPKFTGITTYTDAQGRYEFRHPSDWWRSELDNDLEGVIVGPERDDPATYFAVQVADLGVNVVADDLDVLKEGFDAGLTALPDATVETASDDTYNELVKLERTFTFTEDGVTRRRRTWAVYADHWQVTVVFQGSSPTEYDYWLPMGNYCFMSFQLPLALWFATDPAVSGS